MIYSSSAEYIDCVEDLAAKIARIDEIINALESAELRLAEAGEITSYDVDSGQGKIKTVYTTVGQIENSIKALERRRNRLVIKCRGRFTALSG